MIPDEVYAIGAVRDAADYYTPITTDGESGVGLAPLTVLDADGERALPVFTTRVKAEQGILHFMTEEERASSSIGVALVGLASLLETMETRPEGALEVDYVGVDMGEGGQYPLIRL